MMAQSSENVIPTLRDFFNSQRAGEENDEFMFYRDLKSIPRRPTKMAKERQRFFFNHGSKERSRRNISNAEKFSVEQYSSGGFFGVRLNTNGRQQQQQQQQRSVKSLASERNMEPRLQKSFSARMQSFPFMPSSSKGSNHQSSSSTSWFSRLKKMSNPFSYRDPLIPKSGEIKVSCREVLSRNKSSSPVHLHAYLSMQYELGMPVFTFSLDHPDDVYMARTWIDDNDSRFVYSFRYIGGRSNRNIGEQRLESSSLIGQMQVSTHVCLEVEEPYEDPVESAVSEFVLFDIARARRSGFKNEQLSRQNSFRRGLDQSQTISSEREDGSNLRQEKLLPRQNSFGRGLTRNLSKHSENSAASDPWQASDLHPGLEIAAIVIRDSSSWSNEVKNSKQSRREVKVIVPTGNHGLPDAENSCPTPILQRWRSGGGCDCSGWDMGCHLFVLETPVEEQELIGNNHHGLGLFIEGEKEITPAMTMAFIREGHYEVNFHAKLSALQAFSVCVAELHRSEVTTRGERSSNSLSRCSSLRELIEMETPVNREEVLSSFMPNVTFSPISRV
ncbi:unnamed protein product [Thlaspi arvense]|uniref:Uncharacterized protein n=1 Tax=Thlaspi arvense TaxID=13288 RepID=A0AAU9RWK7_THLAR|nr:unnamed protein product [Thlaspi arvense]